MLCKSESLKLIYIITRYLVMFRAYPNSEVPILQRLDLGENNLKNNWLNILIEQFHKC